MTKPLMKIEMDTLDSVPVLFYKGERISANVKISFEWETKTGVSPGKAKLAIDHYRGKENKEPILIEIREVR